MRTEEEMFDLILSTARADDRVRAVIMNGSRANPSAPRDIFMDYDIVYFVTDPAPYRRNLEWIKRFGELMILQQPDDMGDAPLPDTDGFAYLMQFADGTRIDLGLYPLKDVKERCSDSQTILLLDKDGILPGLPPASEADYLPKPPAARQFGDCCNEFWWVSPYVAKGLWRQEPLYAKEMLDQYVREQLMKMLRWHIGLKTGFKVNPGKCGKYFHKYLEPELWEKVARTYSGLGYDETWDSLFAMCDLFRTLAVPLAAHYGFEYPFGNDQRVSAHLKHVRQLPGDADVIYP